MTFDRRDFLAACTRAGITSALLPGVLYTLAAQAQETNPAAKPPELSKITPEMLDQAAALAGVGPFTADQKQMMLQGLNDQRDSYAPIRALKIPNSVAPAYVFHPQNATRPEPAMPSKRPVFFDGYCCGISSHSCGAGTHSGSGLFECLGGVRVAEGARDHVTRADQNVP